LKNKLTTKLIVIIKLLRCYTAANALTVDVVHRVGNDARNVGNISFPALLVKDLSDAGMHTWIGDLLTGETKISTESFGETIRVLVEQEFYFIG
jgi:hypothetical protein